MTFTGCPCGCTTKLPYLDDPDCARHRQRPAAPPRRAARRRRSSVLWRRQMLRAAERVEFISRPAR